MPRNNETKICEKYEEMKCLLEVVANFTNQKTSRSLKPCDCLENCNKLEYFVDFGDQQKDNFNNDFHAHREFSSRLNLNIFDLEIEEYLIFCSYDSINFFVDFAGLTGLFTGCSLISVFELFFFVFIRLRKKSHENTPGEHQTG